ncbi:hypothetical protein [Neobacillus kokaensis]|uniref:Uncharacterized protein n=1 Tax=Neobacillus kokaensis TaxID=2759023 RepID=A0ABQ3N3I8_9BACI|nr:hypothetical protein [Neobacillus kokaensis]GHH99515.1 hypothetical protein AM1BK_30580 [Neobacillus kokaensis]
MVRANLNLSVSEILERVKEFAGSECKLGAASSEAELDAQIRAMSKAQLMDTFIDSFEGSISSTEICSFVKAIFDFDLDVVPVLSKELAEQPSEPASKEPLIRKILDSQFNQPGQRPTGAAIRQIINQVTGINLDAISSLEGARISLFSKGKWVVQNNHDLFVVDTGDGDVDVSVYPTKYFTAQTGLTELPAELQYSLSEFGFKHEKQSGNFYYSNPACEAVPDSFKGQTMGAILKVIRDSYRDL